MSGAWSEIRPTELGEWEERLGAADAALFQRPFWNEANRGFASRPRYLRYGSAGAPEAFASVLIVGVPGFRVGLVRRGPVDLAGKGIADEALVALQDWARRDGLVFLRFTDIRPEFLDRLEGSGASRLEPFPFYRDLSEELVVPQQADESAVLAGFQPLARRWIAQANDAGYTFSVHDSAEKFAESWFLFEEVARTRRIRFRPLASWQTLIRGARAWDAVRIYLAEWEGRPVETLLVVRGGGFAWSILGALAVGAVGGRVNPSLQLHWRAMRNAYREWSVDYNLNSRMPYSFKRQFNPIETKAPVPAVLVTRPGLFRLWHTALDWSPSPRRLKRLLFR